MFYLFTGNMGAGKSAVVTSEIVDYLKAEKNNPAYEETVKCRCDGDLSCYECDGKGVVTIKGSRHIYTNLPIVPQKVCDVASGYNHSMAKEMLKKIHVWRTDHVIENMSLYDCLPPENIHSEVELMEFWEHIQPNSIVVVDEVQRIFWRSSDKFKGKGDNSYLKRLIDFITGHRHELHDIIFVCQDRASIHQDILNFIGKYYEIRNSRNEPMFVDPHASKRTKDGLFYNAFSHITFPWLFFIVEEFQKKGRSQWMPLGRRRVNASKELFSCYQSFSNLGAHRKIHKDAKSADKGYNAKKQWSQFAARAWLPFLIVFGVIFGVWSGWRSLIYVSKNHLSSRTKINPDKKADQEKLKGVVSADLGNIKGQFSRNKLIESRPLPGQKINPASIGSPSSGLTSDSSVNHVVLSPEQQLKIKLYGSKGYVSENVFVPIGVQHKGYKAEFITDKGIVWMGSEASYEIILDKKNLHMPNKPFIIASGSTLGELVTYLNSAYGCNYIARSEVKLIPFSCNHYFMSAENLLLKLLIENDLTVKDHETFQEFTLITQSREVLDNNGIDEKNLSAAFGGSVSSIDDKLIVVGSKSDVEGIKKSIELVKERKITYVKMIVVLMDETTAETFGVKWDSWRIGYEFDRILDISNFIVNFKVGLSASKVNSVFDAKIDTVVKCISGKEFSIFLGETFQRILEDTSDEGTVFKSRLDQDNTGLNITMKLFNSADVWEGALEFEDSRRVSKETISRIQYQNHILISDSSPASAVTLKREWRSEELEKIPWLSNIPILGYAFKNKEKRYGKAVFKVLLQKSDVPFLAEPRTAQKKEIRQ